jgi:D-alanyl-D-alanine endopeptidase (penicillin-binding protein 7)
MKNLFILLVLCVGIAVHAKTPSFGIYDINNNRWHQTKDVTTVRPIASITKLMTAMVALDYDFDLQRKLILSRRVPGQLPPGSYSRYNLVQALLVKSDNAAAETLAEDFPGGRSAFIAAPTMDN